MGGFIFLTLTIALGIGLFCATCVWLDKTDRIKGKVVWDEKTDQLVYKASLFEWVSGWALFLFIWGLIVFYMIFDGFSGRGLL